MNRIECILNVMEQIKRLYVEGVSCIGQPLRREECMFDPQCPVAGCPFKTNQPEVQIASTNRNVRNTSKGTKVKFGAQKEAQGENAQTSLNEEIEDDADLFVVRVGRADSCRKDVLEHRDRGTLTDFPEESLPPPPKSKSKSTRRRRKRKSFKNKTRKSVSTRK